MDNYSKKCNREQTGLYEKIWDDIKRPNFPKAIGEYNTEVLIIGGGMAGILIARRLHELGMDYMLVEARRIGSGTTCGTTAVITAQHDTLYQDIADSFDEDVARLYLRANIEAVNQFKELSKHIPCDYESKPSFMVTRSRIEAKILREEVKFLNSFGFNAKYHSSTELPYRIGGAVEFPQMGQMHPLKLLYGAARGLNIFENTFIKRVEDKAAHHTFASCATNAAAECVDTNAIAFADNVKINAKHIVVTTHFPFINKHGLYFMKLYQNRSFVVALKNAQRLLGTYTDTSDGGVYLRSYGDILMVGGGDHRTGKNEDGFARVRKFVRDYLPNAKECFAWATQDCMSLDGIPYIGRYSHNTPHTYVATGFNEWGMTSSMIAANIIPDLIMGKENKFERVFDPSRTILRKQLFANIGEAMMNLVTPTKKRCPHMGCALKWNRQEHTWDCPCHGSRFEKNGELICNPSMKDAKIND